MQTEQQKSRALEVENLTFFRGTRQIFSQVSFNVEKGGIVSVLGANGAGKTSLFKCILGLHKAQQGNVRVAGENILSMSEKERAKRISYVPQSHESAFEFRVKSMVSMSRFCERESEKACEVLESLGILHLAERNYAKISGGERQLALIARAIFQGAPVIVMDEPTASLDFGNQIRIMQKIRALSRQGLSVLFSTHSPDLAKKFSDRTVALKDGKIFACGNSKTIIDESLIFALYGVTGREC